MNWYALGGAKRLTVIGGYNGIHQTYHEVCEKQGWYKMGFVPPVGVYILWAYRRFDTVKCMAMLEQAVVTVVCY
jgi:hypothetical protein